MPLHEGNPKHSDDCCDSWGAAPEVPGTTINVRRMPELECSSMKSSAKAGEFVFAPSGFTPDRLARSALRFDREVFLLLSQPGDE
jgi:hypothetical protein